MRGRGQPRQLMSWIQLRLLELLRVVWFINCVRNTAPAVIQHTDKASRKGSTSKSTCQVIVLYLCSSYREQEESLW